MNTPLTSAPLVRAARLEDAERLAELAGQLGYPTTPQQIRERFKSIAGDREQALFVAELQGEVIGWVQVLIYELLVAEREGEIGGLVVGERYRGRGVGRSLMQHAESWARQQGCPSVYLRSNIIRSGAHEFYRRLGYSLIKSQYAFRKALK
jgi:GNAT superfamily N-acetyltransferase